MATEKRKDLTIGSWQRTKPMPVVDISEGGDKPVMGYGLLAGVLTGIIVAGGILPDGLAKAIDDAEAYKLPSDAVETSEPDASPAAIKLAGEHDIDLADVKGTGVNGNITQTDVKTAIDAAANPVGD